MKDILDRILNGEATDLAGVSIPDSYRAVTVHADEQHIFDGLPHRERDPGLALHLDEVPTPVVGPGEALVAVMASAVNYNTVWSSIFAPVSTFRFLNKLGKTGPAGARHDLPMHVLGSDMSGVVLNVGPGVSKWKPGDRVVAHCLNVDLQSPDGHDDTMLDTDQRIWGYETNFGGMAHLALVRSNQLMPKPAHLTWEEAACSGLVNSTAYRQLVSQHGGAMKQGDIVLIWGATGGLGSYAVQYALNGGAVPIAVVSSPERAEQARRQGVELVIDRKAEDYRFWREGEPDEREWRRFGSHIRDLTGGEDPDIVFEHPGRDTFGASVYVARRGGKIVTCASTSGFRHEFDNRYLWMNLKSIIGTHFANYREAWQANRLIDRGNIHPTLSRTYDMDRSADAVTAVHRGSHMGKVGVLCLAPTRGLGVTDPVKRARHLDRINSYTIPRSDDHDLRTDNHSDLFGPIHLAGAVPDATHATP
ncbi:crotonyl-CoA carboxylase/reductase [Nocardia alba]|uniref:Crotonyl-CoA carboxylase/reductase n=1 Tax=Nocardia alba TaxID=225051 RepID=A0A4R1F6E0_9NOCA|nr:crotonyl-CoA carboxylase/reductase [Nocardia alba]TCJ89876.1 crotonyl-CoA carboxylase/reductase [Nocardia alba]